MQIFFTIIEEFKTVIDGYFIFMVLIIGLFTLFIDVNSLKAKKLKRESVIAKVIGISYIIGGPLMYIILKIL